MYLISDCDFVWVLFGLTACRKSCPFNLLRLTPSGRNIMLLWRKFFKIALSVLRSQHFWFTTHTHTRTHSKSPFCWAEKQTSLCIQNLDQCRKPCSCARQLSGIRQTMCFDMLIHCLLATSSLRRFRNACINGGFFHPPRGLQHKWWKLGTWKTYRHDWMAWI